MAVTAQRPGRQLTGDEVVSAMADTNRPEERLGEPGSGYRPASSDVDRPGWVVPVAVALAVGLVALIGVTVFFGAQAVSGFALEHGRGAVQDAAAQAASSLTNFDYTRPDADLARLNESTTADFQAGFAGDKDSFIKSLRQGQTKMVSRVTSAGVMSYSGDTAHVLVAVKSQISTTGQPQPIGRDYRIDITMLYQHRSWLANEVEFIP